MWVGKRLFDLVFSFLGLCLLSPFFVLIAAWIVIDSRGPVFFRQERVGKNGNTFLIHKFRTMSTANQGLQITVGNDPRITKSGSILRKFKIDELPQLIDVFRGVMSFVGPRPEVPRYVAYYPQEIKDKVLAIKPGITDWASLEFKDESAILGASQNPERDYVEKILPIKLKYHLRYAEEASLAQDVKVILLTLKAIVFRG